MAHISVEKENKGNLRKLRFHWQTENKISDHDSNNEYEDLEFLDAGTDDKEFINIGQMNSQEATELLQNKPEGFWLLRMNNNEEERISLKRNGSVVHIKLYRTLLGVALTATGQPLPLPMLLAQMIKENRIISQITERC